MSFTGLDTGIVIFALTILFHNAIMTQVNRYKINKLEGCFIAKKEKE
tara:strand:- start:240 stop:380 length:141 start_codon:yes stop_codon:yes gene_type:complete